MPFRECWWTDGRTDEHINQLTECVNSDEVFQITSRDRVCSLTFGPIRLDDKCLSMKDGGNAVSCRINVHVPTLPPSVIKVIKFQILIVISWNVYWIQIVTIKGDRCDAIRYSRKTKQKKYLRKLKNYETRKKIVAASLPFVNEHFTFYMNGRRSNERTFIE